ncbi:hypothetical protein S40288_11092 [Stachybotrys chartarum IBT 40288]|nr:hypothetical protein S40288_11092 [Stachybotrys chartarum IBT 40288]
MHGLLRRESDTVETSKKRRTQSMRPDGSREEQSLMHFEYIASVLSRDIQGATSKFIIITLAAIPIVFVFGEGKVCMKLFAQSRSSLDTFEKMIQQLPRARRIYCIMRQTGGFWHNVRLGVQLSWEHLLHLLPGLKTSRSESNNMAEVDGGDLETAPEQRTKAYTMLPPHRDSAHLQLATTKPS